MTRRFNAVIEWKNAGPGMRKYTAALLLPSDRQAEDITIWHECTSYEAAVRVADKMQLEFETENGRCLPK
jgi:hypothetical protein